MLHQSSLKGHEGDLFISAPLPLKSVSLTGHVDHFLANLCLSHVFEADPSTELDTLSEEMVFRLVWPDFSSQVLSFEFVDSHRTIKALPTDSKWSADETYRKHAPSSGPNVYTAVLSKAKRVELRLRFLAPLRFLSSRWQLQVPLHLCELSKDAQRNQDDANQGTIDIRNEGFKFTASVEVNAPEEAINIISDTHTIVFERSGRGEGNREAESKIQGKMKLELSSASYSSPDLIVQFPSAHQAASRPLVLVESPTDEEDEKYWKKTAMVVARPVWSPAPHPCDITLAIDSKSIDIAQLCSELRSFLEEDISTLSDSQSPSSAHLQHASQSPHPGHTNPSSAMRPSLISFNLTILTRYGPQWAFPKPMPLSSDVITKLSAFVDLWPSLVDKQGRRSETNFPLSQALSLINSRPSEHSKQLILFSNFAKSSSDSVEKCIAASQALRVWNVGFGLSHGAFALQYLSNATDARYEPAYTLLHVKSALKLQLERAKSKSLCGGFLSLVANPSSPPPHLLLRHISITPKTLPPSALNAPGDQVQFFIGLRPSFFEHGFHTQVTALEFEIKAESSHNIGSAEVTGAVEFEKATVCLSLPLDPSHSHRKNHSSSSSLASFARGSNVQLAAGMELLLDFEEMGATDEPYLQLCQSLSLLNVNSHLYATQASDDLPSVTLFNVAENDFHSNLLQHGVRNSSQVSQAISPRDNAHRITRDVESLMQVRKTVDKASKPNGSLFLISSSTDLSSPASSSPSKATPRKHAKTPSKQRTRPVLTIQSCWTSSAVLVQSVPSKPMQQYEAELKQMNSTLNKITEENMERLGAKLISEPFSADPYALSSLARLIYDKAVRQQMYSTLYTRLIRFLMEKHGQNGDTIRRAVLDHCRNEFGYILDLPSSSAISTTNQQESIPSSSSSSSLPPSTSSSLTTPFQPSPWKPTAGEGASASTPPSSSSAAPSSLDAPPTSSSSSGGRPRFFNSKMDANSGGGAPHLSSSSPSSSLARVSITEDAEEKETKAREQRVGLIVFLATLLKHNLINTDITQNCIGELFSGALRADPSKCNELLVLAIKYIELVGKHIQQVSAPVIERTFQYIDTEVLAENPHLDSRTKTLFQNLIDLKDRHWVPREENTGLRKTGW